MPGWNLTDLLPPGPDAPTVLSTFSCGGGSSMGYKRAGCRVIGAVDIDPKMMSTYLLNFPGTPAFVGGVGDVTAMTEAGLIEAWAGVDILDGSPPCTTFSTGGTREKSWGQVRHFNEGDTAQILDQLFFDYLRLVDAVRPKVFIAENVQGMLMGNARGYVAQVVADAKTYGYDVQVFLLPAGRYGVPQLRRRVFFIGRRTDLNLPPMTVPPPRAPTIVADALEGVGCGCGGPGCHGLTPLQHEIWGQTVKGRTGADYYRKKKGYPAGSPGGFTIGKLNPKGTGTTISSSGMYFHWDERRVMCWPELLRLATFPDDYRVDAPASASPRTFNRKVLFVTGMSVPPFLMEAVARQVRADVLRS